MQPLTVLGFFSVALACCTLYFASPNQRILSGPIAKKLAYPIVVLLVLVGLVVLMSVMSKLTAIFVLISVFMACLIAIPYLAALKNILRNGGSQ